MDGLIASETYNYLIPVSAMEYNLTGCDGHACVPTYKFDFIQIWSQTFLRCKPFSNDELSLWRLILALTTAIKK